MNIKVELNDSKPTKSVSNLSPDEIKLTPRRSRRISKSEEPEELDLSILKRPRIADTIDEDSENEFSDSDSIPLRSKTGE